MIMARIKEFFRKLLVGLKRKPQNIAMLMLVVCFVYYSFHLTLISDTTSRIQGPGMGIYGFVTMLFSMLSFMCFMNAFPHRKKTNIPMLVLLFIMTAAVIFADIQYRNLIIAATTGENAIVVTEATIYIAKAYTMLGNHIVLLIVFAVLTALLPLYAPLIKKIKTSVEVEGNDKMGAIEIED